MRMRLSCLLFATMLSTPASIGFPSVAFGQEARPRSIPDKPDEAPRLLPDGCFAITSAEMHSLQGTDGYRFLRREIETLSMGHIGRQQMSAAMAQAPGTTHLDRLAMLKTGMDDAQNSFLCSSFLVGNEIYANEGYASTNKDDNDYFGTWGLGYMLG